MKYFDIEKGLIEQKPIFSAKDLKMAGFKIFPYQLSIWQKQGYIKKLAAGLYVFSSAKVSDEAIANKLREPSYISLEYALYYYGLIPDVPKHITCVTTRRTQTYNISGKLYIYQHVKPKLFTDFIMNEAGIYSGIGKRFFIATKEKAIVDFFYLNGKRLETTDDFEGARFNENDLKNDFDWSGAFAVAHAFGNAALEKRLQNFKKYILKQ